MSETKPSTKQDVEYALECVDAAIDRECSVQYVREVLSEAIEVASRLPDSPPACEVLDVEESISQAFEAQRAENTRTVTPPACAVAHEATDVPHTCPVCAGAGHAWKPPHVPGDQAEWMASNIESHQCRPCTGTGIIWRARVAASTEQPKREAFDEAAFTRLTAGWFGWHQPAVRLARLLHAKGASMGEIVKAAVGGGE